MNKVELLNEKDKLNHEYWKLKEKSVEIYQVKRKWHSKYLSVCRKIKDIEKRMLEIIQEYNGG